MTSHQIQSEENEMLQWIEETFRLRGMDLIPRRLYKFVSVDSEYFHLGLQELMLNDRIYLSSRLDFNDPFDSSVPLDASTTEENIRAFEGKLRRDHPGIEIPSSEIPTNTWLKAIQANLDQSADSFGIYSLTDSVSNPLMWAHYAASHRGLALVFRHGVKDTFGAFPIRYQADYPLASIGERGIDVVCALVKGMDWSYEGEWRIVEPNMARSWKDIGSFCGVVFGARTTEATIEEVMSLCRRRGESGRSPLAIYRAQVGRSFELKFQQLRVGGWQDVIL